ncbi:hypothetical protein [Dokdonella soli]|uniref:Cell surface protein n=1 Tax=Dokdonella soli TaxID=529810 RepID=A0ABN1II38_9GAMM
MKRNNLTTAVVAGIAGVAGFAGLANAVDLNPDGLGQVLIYPYYTVNKSQDTALSVVNTTTRGKAVKVRFLEGYNSREVLDFNLYLSPDDVWTARVSQTSDTGGAAVFTADHSCTYPAIPSTGVAFRASAYAGGSVFPADGGPTSITRTREGYIELIEMGEIIPTSPLAGATTHVQGSGPNSGVPKCTLSVIGNGAGAFLSAPRGGLFGSGSIVNVGQGTFFGYNADAIDGFSSIVLFSGSSGLTPSLQQANTTTSTFVGGAIAYVFDNGVLRTLDYAKAIDAVSAVFEANAVYNEWLAAPGLGAATDWVLTFPTKRFYVDPFYVTATVVPPFAEVFGASNAGQSNMQVGINMFDQEEGTITQPDDFSPPSVGHPSSLPYEVNVISFLASNDPNAGTTSGVFGSKLVSNIPPYGIAGWLSLDLASGDGGHLMRAAANGDVLHGLPVTGFEAYDIINANAQPGKLANYGGVFRHRVSRQCTLGATAQSPACS